ncbi:hypothetical protein EV663_11716 [Rhodovulum bhavnagarense]|uniref:Uncharacterized protein n=1 Tax=Rhodovulum bhavnagarense TaxID=992286 RepID=A0A4R2R6Q4_9RHOB|nr:hypothetical protein [Rhodovulum bhavnagarense]TCP58750.1 hypothetical protein EV663_11716 [Rhodovulum bhavnagarense]
MTLQDDAEEKLNALSREAADSWLEIGRVLLELEALSRTAPAGKSWIDMLRERLDELDAPVSIGHMHKIRRAAAFLHQHAPETLEVGSSTPPRISSVEIAERLYRLDPDAGLRALADATAANPVPYVELKKMYDAALETRPEMKSPRQVAWEARKKAVPAPDQAAPSVSSEDSADEQTSAQESGPPKKFQKKLEGLLSNVWKDGWQAAKQQDAAENDALRSRIQKLEGQLETVTEAARGHGRLSHEIIRKAAALLRDAPDLFIYAPPIMDPFLDGIFRSAFPKADVSLPMKPQIQERRSRIGRTANLFTAGDAALVLGLSNLPEGYDFEAIFQHAKERDVAMIVLQAVPFEIPQPWVRNVFSLGLTSQDHDAIAAIRLAAAVADIRVRAAKPG